MPSPLLLNAGVATCAALLATVATLAITGTLSQSELPEPQATHQALSADAMQVRQSSRDRQADAVATAAQSMTLDEDLIIEMQQDLLDASLERTQLADSVAQLNRQLQELESDLINRQARDNMSVSLLQSGPDGTRQADENIVDFSQETDTGQRLNALLVAGVDSVFASELQARQDQYELSRLELIDLADREGWIDSDEFERRIEELEAQRVNVRDEIGDSAYDRYLYESGRRNRVIVSSVINGSAADAAGLQRGDVIISYAGERVFSTRDLQSRTRSGTRGESVVINFERERQTLTSEIPRGPMGVTLTSSSQEPS